MKRGFFFIALGLFIIPSLARTEPLVAKKVYTGETIKVTGIKKVNYIGLDAPGKGRFFYNESKIANKDLVYKNIISIEYDTLRKDNKGRILGYVYVGDIFVNAYLLKNGYALAHIVPPNFKYRDLFISLQQEARKNRKGIWAFEKPNDEFYYIGSKHSREFHRPQCRYAENISFDRKVIFRSKEEALNQGYTQDWRCNPLFLKQEENK